jgi:predicted regulator of Ras-like GTPase activity (Roadblock/LC7/MglB family)
VPAATVTAAVLRQFAAIEGVQWAVLADREGFLLDASSEDVVSAEVAGALSACLAESSEGLGRELGRGPLHGMILEYEQGMVVLYGVGASALLAIALAEPTVLGKVRYYAKKAVPELLQAL